MLKIEKGRIKVYRAIIFLIFFFIPFHLFASFKIFVFNPESQLSRARFVKAVFEAQCRKVGISCSMQIFAKSVDFEKITRVQKPQFAIVASYYYTFKRSKFNWKPLFSGYRGRASGFNKILLSKGKRLSQVRYISTVAIGLNSINPVEQRFLNSISRKKIFVTTVSKEIDAIMGLALSQVDGAIVTQRTLNTLKRINPGVVKPLKTIKKLPLIRYPKILSFPGVKGDQVKEMKAILSEFVRDSKKGRRFFTYFGVTAFK